MIRLNFRHRLSPPFAASDVLLGIPSLDLYADPLVIKFLIKVILHSGLVSTDHADTLRVKSTAHNLQCSLNRYLKYFNIIKEACFHNSEMVAELMNRMRNKRWRCPTNTCFLKHFFVQPSGSRFGLLVNGHPWEANQI